MTQDASAFPVRMHLYNLQGSSLDIMASTLVSYRLLHALLLGQATFRMCAATVVLDCLLQGQVTHTQQLVAYAAGANDLLPAEEAEPEAQVRPAAACTWL
jgi:hypothetical protein